MLECVINISEGTRLDLVETIAEEAERLEKLVANLLDMTRLEGGVALHREWVPLEEIVGSALVRLEKTLAGHPIRTALRYFRDELGLEGGAR